MEQKYMEILLEEMRGKFDLVLEGHTALHAKIDEYRQESNEKHDFTAIRLQTVKDRIDNVEQKLSARIDAVEESLTTKIDTVERNLTTHIKAVAADLAAHRADTEAHPRCLVRE